MTLDELLNVFRSHLHLPDPAPVEVVLGTIAANLLPGDPVWLLLVGPPSSGKTEILSALSGLGCVHEVSTFTEPGLLSGSVSRRPGATGGLLAEVGEFGIVVCKDFTSLLSESPDTRSGLLAALREIYDGSWVRRLGSEGGRTLAWSGKIGLLAGVTETIDRHSAVMGAMGERFALFRMPRLDENGRLSQGRTAARNAGRQGAMRAELKAATREFFDGLRVPKNIAPLSETEAEWLVRLADLASRCRSAIERDARDREIELVPEPELPARLLAVLTQLVRGLRLIGVSNDETHRIVTNVAFDGMSKVRRAVVGLLVIRGPSAMPTTRGIADELGLAVNHTGRTLDDLAALRVVTRHAHRGGELWEASLLLRERWASLGSTPRS